MEIKVNIASPLRKATNGNSIVLAKAKTIHEMLLYLRDSYPNLIQMICNSNMSLKPIVTIYVDDEDISFLEGENTILTEKCTVYIIPMIAGG